MKQRRITVRGIIFRNDELLCQRLTPGQDGAVRDYWCTPGGGLDPGESLHAGLQREMIEETGIAPQIGKLLFIQQYIDTEMEYLEFFFHIENPEAYEVIDLSTTTHGLAEIEQVAFVAPREHNVLPSFLQKIDIKAVITNDTPVVIVDNFSE